MAFLVGFMSQDEPTVGYVHFVGVAPPQRGSGLGRGLYATFDEAIAGRGGQRVECVTSVVNTPSVAFHRAIGFTIDGYRDDPGVDGGRSVLMSRAIGREGLSGDGAVPVR